MVRIVVVLALVLALDLHVLLFSQVEILSRIHHRNLVRLFGVCHERHEKMLVYEFMEGGTLRDHLFGRGRDQNALDWPTRLQIALDAAKGLEYLHEDCLPRIIHRDVKSNNIMLDKHLKAKVIDFGISKFHDDNEEWLTTKVIGTCGYLDPEYLATQRLTAKSDVYAFGVVLMEIISGLSPRHVIFGDHDQLYPTLADLFRQMEREDRLGEVVDRVLGENYDKEGMQRVARVAVNCVRIASEKRPNMVQVVNELREVMGWSRTAFQTAASSSNIQEEIPGMMEAVIELDELKGLTGSAPKTATSSLNIQEEIPIVMEHSMEAVKKLDELKGLTGSAPKTAASS